MKKKTQLPAKRPRDVRIASDATGTDRTDGVVTRSRRKTTTDENTKINYKETRPYLKKTSVPKERVPSPAKTPKERTTLRSLIKKKPRPSTPVPTSKPGTSKESEPAKVQEEPTIEQVIEPVADSSSDSDTVSDGTLDDDVFPENPLPEKPRKSSPSSHDSKDVDPDFITVIDPDYFNERNEDSDNDVSQPRRSSVIPEKGPLTPQEMSIIGENILRFDDFTKRKSISPTTTARNSTPSKYSPPRNFKSTEVAEELRTGVKRSNKKFEESLQRLRDFFRYVSDLSPDRPKSNSSLDPQPSTSSSSKAKETTGPTPVTEATPAKNSTPLAKSTPVGNTAARQKATRDLGKILESEETESEHGSDEDQKTEGQESPREVSSDEERRELPADIQEEKETQVPAEENLHHNDSYSSQYEREEDPLNQENHRIQNNENQPPLEESMTLQDLNDEESKVFQRFQSTIPQSDDKPYLKSLIFSRDGLTYEKDHIAHFLAEDAEPNSITSKLLLDLQYFKPEQILENEPKIGKIMIIKNGKFKLFIVIVKKRFFDSVKRHDLRTCLHNLHYGLQAHNITSIRIAKDQHEVKGSFSFFNELNKEFENSPITITLCDGSIKMPAEPLRPEIIKENHDSLMGGHKGIVKTYLRIREKFYWPGMKSDIEMHIKKCHTCQLQKLTRIKVKQPMQITDTPLEPFDKISIDVVGPLPKTPSGNLNILTIQDNFSKLCVAVPMADQRAVTVADAIANHFIAIYGCPKVILTDKGTNFCSKLISHMAKIFKINHVTTSGYRPQSNGALERSHHSLIEYLRVFSDEYTDWDALLPFAMFSYNTMVHSSTKYTPFELVYGKRARMPTALGETKGIETYEDYLIDLIGHIEYTQIKAAENLIKSKHTSKKYYDRNSKFVEFKEGDFVYVQKEPRLNKMDAHYVGPYEIVALTPRGDVIIETDEGKRSMKHPNKLKKCLD